jgi:hypothetical protein
MYTPLHARLRFLSSVLGSAAVVATLLAAGCAGFPSAAGVPHSGPGTPGEAYSNMPAIAPIGVRIGKYMDVPESAKGPPVDAAKGYRIEELGGKGSALYMVTDNGIQSVFMVYETGVVVVGAPQTYASHIRQAIDEVTNKPITHLIYSLGRPAKGHSDPSVLPTGGLAIRLRGL